jgi:sugar/nucleoside kinase (ribokinase family)
VEAVDSNGSGDVFHGAFAFAITNKMSYNKACIFSSAVSALKCTKIGARCGVPTYEETIEFLKERGANV